MLRSFAFAALLCAGFVSLGCSDDDAGPAGSAGNAGESAGGGGAGATPAAGAGGEGGRNGTPAAGWEGSTPHLTAVGKVASGDVDFTVTGADAANLEVLYCERNYIVPDLEDTAGWAEGGFLEKVELKYNIPEYDGVPAELEVGFLYYAYGEEPNNPLTVGAASSDGFTNSAVNIELSISAEDENGEEIYTLEDVAASGKFYLEEYTGEVGEDGLTIANETGTFGGYLEATLESGATFKLSFTANCGENDLETP